MKYLEGTFTIPVASNKVTAEQWAAIWADQKPAKVHKPVTVHKKEHKTKVTYWQRRNANENF